MIIPTTTYGVIMAQVTTGEISVLVLSVMTTEFAVIGFFVKSLVNELKTQIKDMAKDINDFQVKIPEKYVTKHDCEIMIGRSAGCNLYSQQGVSKNE